MMSLLKILKHWICIIFFLIFVIVIGRIKVIEVRFFLYKLTVIIQKSTSLKDVNFSFLRNAQDKERYGRYWERLSFRNGSR